MFSLLPGVGGAWLYIVVDRTFTSGDVDLCAHLFVDHCRISFFCMFNFCGWPRL